MRPTMGLTTPTAKLWPLGVSGGGSRHFAETRSWEEDMHGAIAEGSKLPTLGRLYSFQLPFSETSSYRFPLTPKNSSRGKISNM